jgi:hypothetical protein
MEPIQFFFIRRNRGQQLTSIFLDFQSSQKMSFFLKKRNKLDTKGSFLTIIDIFEKLKSNGLMDTETTGFGRLG